jgi:16S rRNA (guanine527-N7)-methyltransferase
LANRPFVSRETPDRDRNDVSRETLDRLRAYMDMLLRWNRTINLIARADESQIWDRHIADSLDLLPLLPAEFSHAIDLGSGGGLPGLVLAIATGRPFHLVESDQRKAAFLREAARATAAPATVHAVRIEALKLPPAPLITARALAPLPKLIAWAAPFLAPGGVCIFPKGRSAEDELTAAALQWHMRVRKTPSRSDPAALILSISEIARVGPAPPRPAPTG